MNTKEMSLEDIKELVSESWGKGPKDNLYIATGKGGAINYMELLKGRELTQEEKDEFKDGWYEIGNGGFLTHKGEYK